MHTAIDSTKILLEVNGLSMHPFLKSHQKVLINSISAKKLNPGDIILYKDRKKLICHRFVKNLQKEEGLILFVRPDSNPSNIIQIKETEFIGRVEVVFSNNRIEMKTGILNRINNFYILYIYRYLRNLSYYCKRLIKKFLLFCRPKFINEKNKSQ